MTEEFCDRIFNGNTELPVSLKGHSFENCQFLHCNLKDFDLSYARFLDCSFKESDLSNARIGNTRFRDTSFENCKMLGWQWPQADDLTSPKFTGCLLRYNNFSGMKLKKNHFEQCLFHETDFAAADLSECNFQGSDFKGARFVETNLQKANFQNAINYQIDPITNKLKGAKFSLPEAMGLLTGLGIIIAE